MNIGFIGLGIMGKPMARHLLNAGYAAAICNRSQGAVAELVSLGASACKTPKEVAAQSDVVITMLPDSPEVEAVILGPSGIIEGISSGKIVIDMSSINPASSRMIAARLARENAFYLDAPVSGGEIGALEAKLAIMVGGDEAIYHKVKPILEKLGASITHVGAVGSGNVVKLMNQMMVAIHIAALSEAMAFGKQAGIDPILAYEAIRGGLAGSRVMDTKIHNIARESFVPGFRIELHAKDLRNAILQAKEWDVDVSLTEQLKEAMDRLTAEGYGQEDHSALYRCKSNATR